MQMAQGQVRQARLVKRRQPWPYTAVNCQSSSIHLTDFKCYTFALQLLGSSWLNGTLSARIAAAQA